MKPTILLFLVAVALAACDDKNKNNTKGVSEQDQTFANQASSASQAEIQISGLVSDRSKDSTLRSFALHMIADHVVALNELKMLADKLDITLNSDLDTAHAQLRRRLMTLDSIGFDSVYINSMVTDHRKVMAQFQAESSMGDDADLKAYADKYLPALSEHLATAKKIQAGLVAQTSATGGRKKAE